MPTDEQAVLESTQLPHLRLWKQYYAAALNFILYEWSRVLCACSFFRLFSSPPLSLLYFSLERKVADVFLLLIILFYFLWVRGIGR